MTSKTFRPRESVEIKGAWRGAPWRKAKYLCVAAHGVHAVVDHGGITHYVTSRRIRKRSVKP